MTSRAEAAQAELKAATASAQARRLSQANQIADLHKQLQQAQRDLAAKVRLVEATVQPALARKVRCV